MLAALAALALFTMPSVQAKDWVYTSVNIPAALAAVTNATATATTGTAFALPQGTAWSIAVTMTNVNVGTNGTATPGFDFSPDGTNWTTIAPLKLPAAPMFGTTNVCTGTNFNNAGFNGWQFGRFSYLSANTTNGVVPVTIMVGSFQ